jgi:monofunctional biosynthetic peptidoglycan transglycosylase
MGPAPGSDRRRPSPSRRIGLGVAGAAALFVVGFTVYQLATWPDVAALAKSRPESTAFIDAWRGQRRAAGERDRAAWSWVSWSGIAPDLKRAVVSAEDLEFFFHEGFSGAELKAAIRQAWAEGRAPRGASTITQQLAKNLWLSPSRNPWRKVKEALLTRSLEKHLTKRRILEIYLNVVEFGPGVYGAEAAAQRYFGKSAAGLSEHEAAMLAAGLPRPSSWHPGSTSGSYARYVADIQGRMARAGFLWKYLGASPPVGLPDTFTIPDSLFVPIPILPDTDTVTIPRSRYPAFEKERPMAFTIRRVDYFYTAIPDTPGEGYKLLSQLAEFGVNLLAFTAVPVGPMRTQLTLFPERQDRLSEAALKSGLQLDGPHPALLVLGEDRLGALAQIHERLFEARVNVYAANGVTDGRGGFGCVLYVRPEELERAAPALGL